MFDMGVHKMSIGNRIRELRKKKELSQSELGEMVNLSYGGIAAMEQGRSNPSAEVIIKLSKVFEISADYLLTGKEEAATISPDEQEIIKAVREDAALFNTLKKTIDFKKKMMAQIEMLSQRPMDRQRQAEHS
jgi:transcriptional regulator with XRE-family HTH domain